MSSVRANILFWAQRVLSKKDAPPHVLLELKPDAGLDAAQAAFHKIAKMAHPDLHRADLNAAELELVTSAYARVAGAYQELRSQMMQSGGKKPTSQTLPLQKPTGQAAPLPKPTEGTLAGAAGQMTSKGLVYYRKAESALRRGDIMGAVLQLKMAIAADPLSGFLRSALVEVQAEVGKKS